ncbi:MAG TPA: sulfatase [Planctomycetota bacterium]|nr:sulfatase [Planctomycetota bacterium]
MRTIFLVGVLCLGAAQEGRRPNILLAIADDQSWLHASAYGTKAVSTPAFDRVAKAGVLFTQAFAGSPGCSPSRAALLTGRHHWMIEHAGTHASAFSKDYPVYPDLLEAAGYAVGHTGKGWGPGNYKAGGRDRNPAGPAFQSRKTEAPRKSLSTTDYAANFEDFLAQRPKDKPFCFWYGAQEPHRDYEKGVGLKSGKRLEDVVVPPFLPDTPEIRSDLLDYFVEIEWFDRHLGRILDAIEKAGELENTLVIVTADNGMPFPRAKANLYEYGIRLPLAVAWPRRAPGGRRVDDLVGFVDLTATILDAAGVEHTTVGKSLLNVLSYDRQGTVDPSRTAVYSGRERHSSSRPENLGYPCRALRTPDFLYIRNFKPDLWPAGDPQTVDAAGKPGPMHGGYHDIDGCPTLDLLVKRRGEPGIGRFLKLAVDKRPAEELYDVRTDPGCLVNLAGSPEHEEVRKGLSARLEATLRETGDPRVGPNPDVFETYPRYSPIRSFPPSPAALDF